MRGLPAIWFGLLLLTLLTALTFWVDRVVQPPPPKRDGSTRHDPDYIVNNFSSTRTDGFGNPRYDLAGTEMRHFPDDDSTELTRPHYTIYSQKKQTTQIFSDKGKVSANGENIYFVDNVKVLRAGTAEKAEMTLLTSYLHVTPDQDMAQTDRPVTILQAPHTVISATGMRYYKKDGILNLSKRVKVHYQRPDARAAKPLTLEQVAGNRQFIDKVPSVVKPVSPTAPVVPLEQPDTTRIKNNKGEKPLGSPVSKSAKKAALSAAPKQERRKTKAANSSAKKTSNAAASNKAKSRTKQPRIRKHRSETP